MTDTTGLDDRDCDVSEQFEATVICHDETDRSVTVVATVDRETEFANLVAEEEFDVELDTRIEVSITHDRETTGVT